MPLSWVRNPFVVQTIDTTAFLSSDPAGLTYIPGSEPGTGRIILVNSEIDERPFYKLNNMFTLTKSGEFVGATNLVSGVTREPTGIAYSADANLLFITDDDQHTISIVSATNPSVRLGSIDVSAISSDTEDPFFDNSSGHLFFLEGGGGINRRTIFELTTTGQIIASVVMPKKVGDVEAMVFDALHNVFYVAGGTSPNIFVVSRDGTTILDTITVLSGLINPISGIEVAPKGLILAPSSNPGDDPSVMSLWVADYGKDQKMDGRLFEICLGGWDANTAFPPAFTAGSDTINFNAIVPGFYDPATLYNSLGGDDAVWLPATSAIASASSFNTHVPFSGGAGNDTIIGGALNDTIDGGTGNDVLEGGSGANRLFGGDGNDALSGGSDADQLYGGTGNDTLSGSSGNDLIDGGAGQDIITAGSGNDTVDGGADWDAIVLTGNRADYSFAVAGDGSITITGAGSGANDGIDKVINVETVVFLDGAVPMDVLLGNGERVRLSPFRAMRILPRTRWRKMRRSEPPWASPPSPATRMRR